MEDHSVGVSVAAHEEGGDAHGVAGRLGNASAAEGGVGGARHVESEDLLTLEDG